MYYVPKKAKTTYNLGQREYNTYISCFICKIKPGELCAHDIMQECKTVIKGEIDPNKMGTNKDIYDALQD